MKGNNITKLYDRLAGHVFDIPHNRQILANQQNPEEYFNGYLNLLIHRFMIVSLMYQRGLPEVEAIIDRTRERGNEWLTYQKVFSWVYNTYPGQIFASHPLDQLIIDKGIITELMDFLLGGHNPDSIIYAHEKLISRFYSFDSDRVVVKDSQQRKNSGVFYTPPYIIKYLIRQTLSPQLDNLETLARMKNFKIFDPSCGSGVFLTAAAGELAEFYRQFNLIELDEIPLFIARNNISGIDADPIAVEFCVFNILTALGEKDSAQNKEIYQELLMTIKRGDFLQWSTRCHESYDLIIGNPPFVSGRNILSNYKKYIKDNFPCAAGQFDLIVPFIEGALKLLKLGGKLGFILPNKYLAADFGYQLRKNIIQNYHLEQLTDLSTIRVFKEAAVYPVIQVIGNAQLTDKKVSVSQLNLNPENNTLSVKRQVQIPQEFFADDNYNLSPEISPEIYPILNKIRQQRSRISANKILCGIAKSGFGKDIIDQEKYIEILNAQINYKRILQASDINPYKINPNYKYIINSASTPGKWKKFDGPKLVVPGIAKKLMAALDRENSALGRLYFIREETVPWDLYFLLGLFNSAITRFYYHILFWPVHQSGNYLRMNSTYLAQIPIPDGKHEIQKDVAKLARMISEGNTDNGLSPKTSEIDDLLARMYGLTEIEMNYINNYKTGG